MCTFENFNGDLLVTVEASKDTTESALAYLDAERYMTGINFPVISCCSSSSTDVRQLLMLGCATIQQMYRTYTRQSRMTDTDRRCYPQAVLTELTESIDLDQ